MLLALTKERGNWLPFKYSYAIHMPCTLDWINQKSEKEWVGQDLSPLPLKKLPCHSKTLPLEVKQHSTIGTTVAVLAKTDCLGSIPQTVNLMSLYNWCSRILFQAWRI